MTRSQYKQLPKIQALRKRNDCSTVFEKEPWAYEDDPPLARATEYKQNYHPEYDPDSMEYQEQPRPERLYVSDSEKHSVMMLVPRNVLLPSEPIVLPKEKERILCKLICMDLEGFDERKLRDIYMDASLRDPELNGYCDIQYLDSVLRERGVSILYQGQATKKWWRCLQLFFDRFQAVQLYFCHSITTCIDVRRK